MEHGRALGRREIEDVIGVRVTAEIDIEPTIARRRCRPPRGTSPPWPVAHAGRRPRDRRNDHQRLARQVHRHLVEVAVDDATGDLATEAERHLRALALLLPRDDREQVLGAALAHAQGLGPLEPLLADPTVTEILVNAGTEVWVERAGQLERAAELADGAAELLIERIIGPLGLRVDRLKPTVDARLADGSRFHAVIPPVAVDGPCLAIRRFAARLCRSRASPRRPSSDFSRSWWRRGPTSS